LCEGLLRIFNIWILPYNFEKWMPNTSVLLFTVFKVLTEVQCHKSDTSVK